MQTITFSEQPYGTIDPVYHCKTNTISFFGTVVTDGAQPDSPVLAYDQSFLGPVSFTFSDPVSHVSFDVGYFDDLLTTNVSFYDSLGNLLDSEDNFQFGIEHYSLDSLTGIARVVITPLSEDPAGFSVDSISFTNEPQQVFASGNQDIDGLLWGYKWDHKNLTYSFPTSSDEYTTNGYAEVDGFEGLSAIQIAAYGKIIANFGAVCGLTFTKTAGPNADLRFAQATDVDYSDGNSLHVPGLLPGTAEAMAPDPEHATVSWGDVWFSHDEFPRGNDNSHPVLGNFIYTAAFMHELGHAVGLKHGMISQSGHGYNFPPLPADHDSQEYSVMTYNTSPGVKGDTDQYPQSLMQDDIVALQYIYGANYKSNSGATNYRWDPHTGQEFVNGVGQGTPVANFIFLTVWDGGGTDLYDFSAYASALKIDLRPGAWTNLGTQIANLGGGHFARGNIANALTDPNNPGETASLIENVTSGSGNDTITGNVVANRLSGGNGNDTLDGREGDDSLFGAAGNDQIVGGVGNDLLAGGVGNDTLTGGVGLDKYLFDTGLNSSTNLDTIADMVPGGDLVVLDQTIFAKLKIGVLKAKFFTVGKHADDKNDYLIYNKKSGELFYDANGDHHGGRVEFAQLSAHLSLSNNDFLVVA